jgi:hypothetical protein
MKKLFFSFGIVGALVLSANNISAMDDNNDAVLPSVQAREIKTMGQRIDSLSEDVRGYLNSFDVEGCKTFVTKNKDYFCAAAGIIFGLYIISKAYGWFHNVEKRNQQQSVDQQVTNPQRVY